MPKPLNLLLRIFVSAIGSIIVLTFGIILLPVIFPQKVDVWSIAGLAATMAGVMAALLAIIGAAVVAFEWIYLERRVERVLEEKTAVIKKELSDSIHDRILAMGEFARVWHYDIWQREPYIQEVLERVPDIPNVAGMMAEEFCTRLPRDKAVLRADYWAKEALKAKGSHDPGLPEFVMAKVRALQKEPESTLDYLSQALQINPLLKKRLLSTNEFDWYVFSGMTSGESQLKQLDRLLDLIGEKRPSLAELREHCITSNALGRSSFTAVNKSNGKYVVLIVEPPQPHPGFKWHVTGEDKLHGYFATFDDVMSHINQNVIPTRLLSQEDL